MRINADRMISEFAALVSIDSPSLGERQMCDYLKSCLESLDFLVTEDDAGSRINGSCGNIYGFLDGAVAGEPLLFCAHMDTVEPSRGKKAVIGENGIITGAGSTVLGADDCSGIAAILEALRTIKARQLPHRAIEIMFTIAEETYCRGSELFDYSKIRSKEAYVLDLTGPVGVAAYQAPTVLSFTAAVSGKSSHAGLAPEDGINAIAAAATAISRLKMGRLDESTTLNVGLIEGGLATNIVPGSCVVRGEVRSYSNARAQEQADCVKSLFIAAAGEFGAAAKVQILIGCEAYETSLDHPVVKRFETACRLQGLIPDLQQTFGGSDNNNLAKHEITGLVLATAMNRCHSCEEYTTVDELCKIAELTLSLMTSEN